MAGVIIASCCNMSCIPVYLEVKNADWWNGKDYFVDLTYTEGNKRTYYLSCSLFSFSSNGMSLAK